MKVQMKYKKSTKNTHVFEEVLPESQDLLPPLLKIPTLYVRKSAFRANRQGVAPQTLQVEVTYE